MWKKERSNFWIIFFFSSLGVFVLLFLAVSRGAQWSGRICCSHALTIKCQNTCATSMSIHETLYGCRRSDEQTLFECFERQENGDNCCGNARTSDCLQVKERIYINLTLNRFIYSLLFFL